MRRSCHTEPSGRRRSKTVPSAAARIPETKKSAALSVSETGRSVMSCRTCAAPARSRGSSPSKRSCPPGRIPSSTSSLARAMFSRVPRDSRCDEPILVMTAISGHAARDRADISPRALMPISSTAARTSVPMPGTQSGIPMTELKFPSRQKVGNAARSTAAHSVLVVVLPTLPVTAITRNAGRCAARKPAAKAGSAATVSGTQIKQASGKAACASGSAGGRSQRKHRLPAAYADAI